MLLVLSGYRYFLPGHKNSGGAKNIKCLFIRWPWLGFSPFLGKHERKNGQHPDIEFCIDSKAVLKMLVRKRRPAHL